MSALFTYLLLPLIISVTPEVELDNQVNDLIHQLQSNKYNVREAATTKLMELGKPAIIRIKKEFPHITDIEVKWRLQEVQNNHVYEAYHNICPIWFLPRKYRIKDGKDIAVNLYKAARDEYNVRLKRHVSETDWNDVATTKFATSKYLHALIDQDIPDDELMTIKREMARFNEIADSTSSFYCNFHFMTQSDDEIPEVFEDVIAKINDAGFMETITP